MASCRAMGPFLVVSGLLGEYLCLFYKSPLVIVALTFSISVSYLQFNEIKSTLHFSPKTEDK